MRHCAERGGAECAKYLVERCENDVNARDRRGRTALIYRCGGSKDADAETVKLLANYGADVNAQDEEGRTPLMLSAMKGDIEAVGLLLSFSADVNATDKTKRTALERASENGHRQVRELILSSSHFQLQSTISAEAPKWLIPATEIEIGDYVSQLDIGGDCIGAWLDSVVDIKIHVPSAEPFREKVDRWFALRHPNTQKLYGAACEGYGLFICEHMTAGSLKVYIAKRWSEWDKSSVPNAYQRLYEAALGLQYLHEREIVHGDVRLENILIASNGIAKLANISSSRSNEGTNREKLRKASDMLALGRCMQTIDSCVPPLGLDPQFRAGWRRLSYDMRRDDLERFTISEAVPRMKTLVDMLAPKTLRHSVSRDRVLDTVGDLQDVVGEIGDERFNGIFESVTAVCEQYLASENHEDTIIVLQDILHAIDERFSPSRNSKASSAYSVVGNSSFGFFVTQMHKVLDVLGAPIKLRREIEMLWPEMGIHQTEEPESDVELAESLPEWFIGANELENETSIACGGFSEVSRAQWLNTNVVVKRMKNGSNNEKWQHLFLNEITLWFGLNHPYVMKIFGGCHVGKKPFFVCEDAKHGSLIKYLERLKKTNKNIDRVWLNLYEASLGLEYLQARGIIHRDLKCDNILVDSDDKAMLTDFGLSAFASAESQGAISDAANWVAPECLQGQQATFASDIFSFEMCIIQAVTLLVPTRTRSGELPPQPLEFTNS